MTLWYPNIPKCISLNKDLHKINVVQFWGFFSEQDLIENAGALLMMDIDFGRKCSLRCPSCFRKSNPVDDDSHRDLTYKQLIKTIDAAQSIGLREIKICGAGEPLENPLLLQFAKDLTQRDIGLSIFTKAHVLGVDKHVAKVYGRYGITNGSSLCKEFFQLKTSFLVSFQSANPQTQDRLVGGVSGYTASRNRGLEFLVEAGFNKTSPTRLAICANPMLRANFGELFDIYVYARERNILPVNAALMISGKQIDIHFLRNNDVSAKEKERLFLQIYEYNLRHGFHTQEQLMREGISCMPGIHPCNQIAAGLYLTCNGNIVRCPGDYGTPLGNVKDRSVVEIWEEHKDWAFKGKFNCHCPFKEGATLPTGLYDRVQSRLLNS
ncbi:MAG: radical SAM protein [Deltaproteobacteria bacterium]|nr:radical SAM protein [Deltaproteobacteria bacterium]